MITDSIKIVKTNEKKIKKKLLLNITTKNWFKSKILKFYTDNIYLANYVHKKITFVYTGIGIIGYSYIWR